MPARLAQPQILVSFPLTIKTIAPDLPCVIVGDNPSKSTPSLERTPAALISDPLRYEYLLLFSTLG
jgi:hypothetical protein